MVICGLFDHVLRRCEYTVLVPNIKEVVCATCMILDQHLSRLCAISAIVLHCLNKVLKLHVKPGKDFKAKLLIVFYFIVVVCVFYLVYLLDEMGLRRITSLSMFCSRRGKHNVSTCKDIIHLHQVSKSLNLQVKLITLLAGT